jgi:hypothetical protein
VKSLPTVPDFKTLLTDRIPFRDKGQDEDGSREEPDLRYEGPVIWLTYKPQRSTAERPSGTVSPNENEASAEGDIDE